MMFALSIAQPWSWLIVNRYKPIENREWTTSFRGRLLIHAGKRVDKNAFFDFNQSFGAYPDELDDLSFLTDMPTLKGYETGGIVGYAALVDVVTYSENPWFRGRYGWVLRNAHPVPLIPLKGQLGLFEVDDEVVAQVREAVKQGAQR